MNSNEDLVASLSAQNILRSTLLKKAFLSVDRALFVPESMHDHAYADIALPLVSGQTISQPTTVAIMLELLELAEDQKVLDIGAGSGWVSCLIAKCVGQRGQVFAYEKDQTVGQLGLQNIQKIKNKNVSYFIANAAKNWQSHGPFDRIHSGAAFTKIPADLPQQLKIGGILVAPTQGGYMHKICRPATNKFSEQKIYGFAFVPFKTD